KVIEMGGTISAQGTDRLDRQNYTSGIYEGNDFLEDLPELNNQVTVDFFNFSQVSSTEIDQTYWLKLRSLIVYFLNKQIMMVLSLHMVQARWKKLLTFYI